MYLAALIVVPAYYLAFIIGQQIIGRHFGSGNIPRSESLSGVLLRSLSQVFFIVAAFTAGHLTHTLTFPTARAVGLVGVIVGLFISWRAQWELGRFWVGGIALHKGHKLITTGPYRYVRHPLYSGMLLSALGLGLVCLNIWIFLMCLCLNGSFICRAPAEDKMLQQKFKKKYDVYASTTGMIIPYIGRRK